MTIPRVIPLFLIGILVSGSPAVAQPKPMRDEREVTKDLLRKAEDEYRTFFERPDKAPNKTLAYWAAIKIEMELGKFDLAGLHLKRLLGKDPHPDLKVDPPEVVDFDLVKIEAAEGLSAFLRLKQVRPEFWSELPKTQKETVGDIDDLIDRIGKAVEKHLSDPVRIRKFIGRLGAFTEEERAFAYVQIARSRERAVPYLIEALRTNIDKPLLGRIREMLLRIGPESVPVYLEVFKAVDAKDARDVEMRLEMLNIVQRRDDKRAVPYLWHLSAAKQYPDVVRKKAKSVLSSLLRTREEDLVPAKEVLTAMAEKHYQGRVKYDREETIIWPWDGEAISLKPVKLKPVFAEEYFGERYAREALDIDPRYQPAQVVFLSMMLDRQYGKELDQALIRPMAPKTHELLTSLESDLITRTLEKAMLERRLPVILPLIQSLGARGEIRAALTSNGSIARALYYPDRRVQFAAMQAMLKMPTSGNPPVASDRIVDLSRRFLSNSLTPKALIVHPIEGEEAALTQIVKGMGYEAVFARTIKGAVQKARDSADFDLVVLHRGIPAVDFSFFYEQLRQNYDIGGLPMVIVVDKKARPTPKALIVYTPDGDEAKTRLLVQELGYTPTLVPSLRQISDINRVNLAEFELVILHHGVTDKEFGDVYVKLRRHDPLGLAPLLIVTKEDREVEVQKMIADNPREFLVGDDRFKANEALKNLVETRIKAVQVIKVTPNELQQMSREKLLKRMTASNPSALIVLDDRFRSGEEKDRIEAHIRAIQGAKFSPAEHKAFARTSMDTLYRIAKGEYTGYDLRAAYPAIYDQLLKPEFAAEAVEILGLQSGKEFQIKLAGLATDPNGGKLRITATQELNRHLQKNGVQIDKNLQASLRDAHQAAGDPVLRAQLTVTVSLFSRSTGARAGADLLKFQPDQPAAPKEKAEKKDN